MLRILNWLAAPLGSAEYLLMNYGLKDTHWTPDDKGNPILNARGKQDALVPFRYITQGPVADALLWVLLLNNPGGCADCRSSHDTQAWSRKPS